LVRKFGMTIDSLLAAEVVTADGRHVHTDAEHDADLFWRFAAAAEILAS